MRYGEIRGGSGCSRTSQAEARRWAWGSRGTTNPGATWRARALERALRLTPVLLVGGVLWTPAAHAGSSKAVLNCQGELGSILSGSWRVDAAAQKTTAYQERGLAVGRPGGSVDVTLTFDKNPERACFDLELILIDQLSGSDAASLDFQPVSDVLVSQGNFTQTYRTVLPGVLPVGAYAFGAEMNNASGSSPRFVIGDVGSSGTRLAVVFDPFSPGSPTYVAPELHGYLEPSTATLKLAEGHSLSFDLDPYAPEALEAALSAISTLSAEERKQPALVVRRVSQWTARSNVLWGRWDGKYSAGTTPLAWLTGTYDEGKKPWEWSGSSDILKGAKTGIARFGQCWCSAGMQATLSRTLGIPSRPVTNFGEVSEKGGSYRAPYFPEGDQTLITTSTAAIFSPDGKGGTTYDTKLSTPTIWNFRVWTEGSVMPTASSTAPEWNAFDATPQEESTGEPIVWQAPVSSVLKNKYDSGFIAGETNTSMVVDVK